MEESSQSKASSVWKVQVKWVEDLLKGTQKRVESPNIKKQTPRYTGYIEIMTKVVKSQSMVGKNEPSKQVPQKKEKKSSCSKGEIATVANLVELKTDPGGQGSSKNLFLAKREC